MKFWVVIVAIVIVVSDLRTTVAQEVSIPTAAVGKILYPWISFLSEGPPRWLEKNEKTKVRGKRHRIVFYEGPEEMPSTFRLEEVTFGEEGCCKALARARKFELRGLIAKTFGPLADKDAHEFVLVKWLSPSSFEFRYYGSPFLLFDLDRNVIKVKRIEKGG